VSSSFVGARLFAWESWATDEFDRNMGTRFVGARNHADLFKVGAVAEQVAGCSRRVAKWDRLRRADGQK
jgi:hypothetical protein